MSQIRPLEGPRSDFYMKIGFRLKKGLWYTLCKSCLDAVRKYGRGGWCEDKYKHFLCSRCGGKPKYEYFPFLNPTKKQKKSRFPKVGMIEL